MFKGSLVALVTPMTNEGAIDYAAFEKLLAWHIEQGTDGLVVLGTTGESATIMQKERQQLIERAIAIAKGKVPVIIGTGANSTQHAIELTHEAMSLGADAALLVTPYYNKPTQEGLYQHYKAIADAVPIPQILYNVPSRTACDLLPETVERLSATSNIVGIKDATGDLQRLKRLHAMEHHLALLSGDDSTAMEFMLSGGDGVISVVANVVPTLFHDMCHAVLANDRAQAESANKKMYLLYKACFVESNPIPVKWLLAKMKKMPAGIRLPLTPLAEQYHATVIEAAKAAGISI